MDLPASYYGKLDKRNPVILGFVREINSFIAVMKRVASSPTEDKCGYAKGIKILMEIWRKYKHRLPLNLYQEHMLQVADLLFELKFFDMALWYGYSLHLQQFTSVAILDIEGVDHFKACFFPKGLDTDQHTLYMKLHALHGCTLCIFEQEKSQSVLNQEGLYKLLCVLDFIRITMQVLQQYDNLCWQIYNGSVLIYNICRYLMTMNYSAQALEYLLWASLSLELSVPLMTTKYVPWIVTLYCAVCQCYYDNHAAVQAEVFARRALVKINELAKLEEQSGVSSSRETQKIYKEASVKLAAMIFKRAVFEARNKPKIMFRLKTKSSLTDIPNAPWPRNTTEQILTSLFEGGAAQFLGILEALRDSSRHPLQTGGPDEHELQEVVLELLAAGISILSGVESIDEQKNDHQPPGSLRALTTSSTLINLAATGESKICFVSAVEFIKLLYYYKQSEAFAEYSKEMLQLLLCLEIHSFRKAELELALLYNYNSVHKERQKTVMSISEEFIELVKTLHKSVCDSDLQPDRDLVLSVILFVWDKVAFVIERAQRQHSEFRNFDKWVWCLSVLCEVAFAFELSTVYCCIMTAEMTQKLAMLLESAAKHSKQKHLSVLNDAEGDAVILRSFSISEGSSTQLFQKVCAVVKRGIHALSKGLRIMLPPNGSAIIDSAYMQKFVPSSPFTCSLEEGGIENDATITKEKQEDNEANLDDTTSKPCSTMDEFLLALDLHLQLDSIYHTASLSLLHLNAVVESELFGWIKKNKVTKALYLIQKAQLDYNMNPEPVNSIKNLLEEASTLIEKAGLEERKLYVSTLSANQSALKGKDRDVKDEKNGPPPPPVLISRTDYSLSFAPAPYHTKEQVCWYQLLGRAAEGNNLKVRLGDCSLPGTGRLVPAESGRCVLKVEGLDPNQKYVFAVAAYNSQGNLLGHSIGETTFPLLASPPLPLLTTWALLAQVAFQTKQYDIAKRACKKLWSHFTYSEPRANSMQYQLVTTRLHVPTLQHSSLLLRQSLFSSIFTETEIDIYQGSLHCNFSNQGPFIWEQIARLAECERMLVAVDLVLWLIDSSDALQAVVVCYGLLSPLIYHQITCNPVIQVLTKCLKVLEENSAQIKQRCSGSTSESLMHRIACMTHYLYKALHGLREQEKARVLMDCGCRLIQEVYDAQLKKNKLINEPKSLKKVDPVVVGQTSMSPQLKALLGKNKNNENLSAVTFTEDHCKMYNVLSTTTIKRAYQEVLKLRQKPLFIESSTLLLQKALEEGEATLVIEWGQNFFEILRKDSRLESVVGTGQNKTKSAPVNDPQDDTRRKVKQTMVQRARTNREIRAGKNMSRYRKQVMLRRTRCEESVWKTNLNYTLAQAHLMLFYQGLAQLQGGPLQHRYSQLHPLNFSVAFSGLSLRMRRNLQPQQLPKCDREEDRNKHKARKIDKSQMDVIGEEDDDSSLHNEQRYETERQTAASMLDSLNKAALHLRRAMVLAHRGGHWAILRCVSLAVWDQYCRTAVIVQRGSQIEPPSLVTAEQQCNIFTPLLVLATELVMDMLNQLGLWRVYERDLPEEQVESCLHFSAPLDDTTKMDMRWVRSLVLHTLEQLHESRKWEKLSHLALLFNTYTRECYALKVTPLLINAQRKLLERIRSFRGPAVPQPHHVKTQKVTGFKVTYKSYAGCQLLSGWTPSAQEISVHKKEVLTTDHAGLKDAEVQRSMALVCVPLDVEDTLYWYRKAVEKRSHSLQFFQHSRTLLLLLLADTQPYYATQFSRSREPSRSASQVEFNPTIMSAPSVKPCDLMEEDYSTPEALYGLPISPEHIPLITTAYSTSINYFYDSKRDSLKVVALHEMGNLHYYNGNTTAAHSCWTNAINCALKSPDALEKWDGVSFGGCSLQQRLKLSGMWGCLQAACLTAKIAQYILTSDISQRTNCCLQSAHLFKCVLCCSLAQPQSDLQYVSDIVIDELLPGLDLFSDPSRVHLGTTITSLNFICHWLFFSGYYIKLLPMLALYLHFVGTVCRDVQRIVECKILKIRALTELGLFTEAVKEAFNLTKGAGIRLPHGHYIIKDKDHNEKTFNNNKSVIDNIEVLEELVNCDITPGLHTLYGSPLCLRYNLVRTQLILAICTTIHSPLQVPDPVENRDDCVPSERTEPEDPESKSMKLEPPKILDAELVKEEPTLGQIKYLLLEAVSTLLSSITKQLTATPICHVEKVELTVESNLLMAKLYLLKGHAVLSSEMAVSSLMLLQSTFENINASKPGSQASQLQVATAGSEKGSNQCLLDGDFLRTVEASERIGFSLWLRCRLTLIHGLTAHAPSNGVSVPGNIKEEAAQAIRDGIEECKTWGDPDSQALLLLEGTQWDSNMSKTEKSTLLKEIVRLVSGRLNMPLCSTITLARATMLLSDMKVPESITFLKLSQKLLQNQMCCFSQNIVLDDGEFYLPCSSYICLPFLHILHLTTLRIGQILGS